MDVPEINEPQGNIEDVNLGFTKELIEEIQQQKANNPGMFVSSWQEDEDGIEEKNMDDPVEAFLTAAEEGNLERVKMMHSTTPDLLHKCDQDGYTALHRAAYNDHLAVVDFLLLAGADPEARTTDGWTVLHSTANWGNYRGIARLLSHGVNVNAVSKGGVTPLHLAVNSKNEEFDNVLNSVRFLLEAPGIDAGSVSGSGDTALSLARRNSKSIYDLIRDHLDR